jgi:hypothetical protein
MNVMTVTTQWQPMANDPYGIATVARRKQQRKWRCIDWENFKKNKPPVNNGGFLCLNIAF